MALDFRPYPIVQQPDHDALVAQQVSGNVQQAFKTLLANQQLRKTTDASRQQNILAYLKAKEDGSEDFEAQFKAMGGQIPGSAPTTGWGSLLHGQPAPSAANPVPPTLTSAALAPAQAMPRTPTSATTFTPTEKEGAALQAAPSLTPDAVAPAPATAPAPAPALGGFPTRPIDMTPDHFKQLKEYRKTHSKSKTDEYMKEQNFLTNQTKSASELERSQQLIDQGNRPIKYVTREQLALQDNTLKPGEQLMPNDPEESRSRNASSQMRQQFLQQSKSYSEYSEKYQTVLNSAKNPSAAGDLSMIYAYMKMLDPTSVVREGEFKSAQVSGSILQRLNSSLQQVKSGQRLDPEIRQDFLNRSTDIYRGQKEIHDKRVGEFQRTAAASGLDPSTVVINLGSEVPEGLGTPSADGAAQGGAPRARTVTQNGHTYTWNPETKSYE